MTHPSTIVVTKDTKPEADVRRHGSKFNTVLAHAGEQCGCAAGPSTRRDRLRRPQASDPVPGGAPTTETGPVHLPIPAEGDGRDDIGEGVYATAFCAWGGSGMSTEVPEILLSHYLKTLKLPTFQREY